MRKRSGLALEVLIYLSRGQFIDLENTPERGWPFQFFLC